MRRPRKRCAACQKRAPRALKTRRARFIGAATDPVFCSRGCAADYGLLAAGCGTWHTDGLAWCRTHGWYDTEDPTCPACPAGAEGRREESEEREEMGESW